MAKAKKKWIKSAVPESHKGIFGAKAERAGETTHEYAEEKKNAGGTLGKEANLALTFEGMHHGGKKKSRSETLYSRDED